ncbi:MAG TPA: hypothetical protein VFN61_10700 [Acidimicrobiales bacterium]|nr:hypothetical protein [Acidimicrobiales bacterium]
MPYYATSTGLCTISSTGAEHCPSPCAPDGKFTYNAGPACNKLIMAAIDRAQLAEGHPAFTLPTDYYQLGPTQQVFVLVNLERISHGVPPLAGYSSYLNAEGARAAKAGGDPVFHPSYGPVKVWYPPAGGNYAFGGAWAGNSVNAAAAVFGWFYDDGWGGPKATSNGVCTSASSHGCWGHRDELLGEYSGISCRNCIAGAGYASPSANGWQMSYSILIVRPQTYPTPLSFTWDANVVPYLPKGWERALAPKS